MTEISYFWDAADVGHATLAPYDNEEFEKILGLLTVFDPAKHGIIRSWGNAFEISGMSQPSLTINVKSGRAMVGNAFYESNATISYTLSAPPSGYFYYTLALRKDKGAQTVRQKMLGPTSGTYPVPVQNDSIWDFPLAYLQVYNPFGTYWTVAGGIPREAYIHPDGSKFFPVIGRLGGSATIWSTPGTTSRAVALETVMQTGVALWTGSASSGSVVVTFPHEFDYAPIVFLGNPDYNNHANWHATQIITSASGISTFGFTINWKSIAVATKTQLHLTWLAIGPKAVR